MSPISKPVLHAGVAAGLVAAALFGAGTPAAKLLLGSVSPWTLAGILYLGSGLGLGAIVSLPAGVTVRFGLPVSCAGLQERLLQAV